MLKRCRFFGHKREPLFFIDDDRKHIVIDQSDCLRCGEPSNSEPAFIRAHRDPQQTTRLLPCPECGSPTHLVETKKGFDVECDFCEYSMDVAIHGTVSKTNLRSVVIKAHNHLWENKKC